MATMPLPPHPRSQPYRRGDLVRCACGNAFIANSAAAACLRCGGRDVNPLTKPIPARPFRF